MKPVLFTLFVMMMLIGMPTAALADDNKLYNGAACIPASIHGGAEEIFYTEIGVLVNTSDVFFVIVTCPIVRDNTTNTNGLRDVRVRVFIPEGANVTGLGCGLSALNGFDGPTDNPNSSKFIGFSGFGNEELRFSGDHSLNVSFPLGQYVLTCSLPAGGKIFSYLVIEK